MIDKIIERILCYLTGSHKPDTSYFFVEEGVCKLCGKKVKI